MTNQEVLEKAWQIATDRGWEFDNLDKWHLKAERKVTTVMNNWYQFIFTYENKAIVIDVERVLYDHDFAKALWGKELVSPADGTNYLDSYDADSAFALQRPTFNWEYHLQQMVIAGDPIKYLGKHI